MGEDCKACNKEMRNDYKDYITEDTGASTRMVIEDRIRESATEKYL